MAYVKHVQFLRGTLAQNNAYTGLDGQITIDTDSKQIRLHDGVTPGGTVFISKKDIETSARTISAALTFTVSPVVPTPATGDNTTKVASTAFVKAQIAADAVLQTGAQTIAGIKTFGSSPLVPTPSASDNSQKAVNTAFVQANVVMLAGAQTIAGAKTFSVSPVVPTPVQGDSSQKAATTAFVRNEVDALGLSVVDGKLCVTYEP